MLSKFEPDIEPLWSHLSFGIQDAWNGLFWMEYLPGPFDATFCALPALFLPSASRDHGGWKWHFEATNVLIPANEDVFKSLRPPGRFVEAAPVLHAVLTV